MLLKGNDYLIEITLSIGDCDGESWIEGEVIIFLDEVLMFNQTKYGSDSEWNCNIRDPENPSEVAVNFRYNINNLEVDSKLNITAHFLQSSKDFHLFQLAIYRGYDGGNYIRSIILGILFWVSFLI